MSNASVQDKDSQANTTPDAALQRLLDGNQRFLNGQQLERDLSQQVAATSTGQFPFAVVLSCIDSRVTPELLFDQGVGDIFTARIAGNFVNDDLLGSMEFGCKVAGSKLILVLGHTGCGAVRGACDSVELGNLTGMLKNIQPAVSAAGEQFSEADRGSHNPDFLTAVTRTNVQLTTRAITERSEVLRAMVEGGEIRIVGAMYDIKTGQVSLLD